ncbi:MAG: peptidoglycan-binding domain-containing protein [Bacteroidota bacterium]
MKQIAVFLVIAVLAFIVWNQHRKLNGLNPPEDYEYQFRDDIDLDYHNPVLVREYFDTGYEIGSFARQIWKSDGIDVRHPDADDATTKVALTRYKRLQAYADSLGARLHRSLQLKGKGYDNTDIRAIEAEGTSPLQQKVKRAFGHTQLAYGDFDPGVRVLQDILIRDGYQIPSDGKFGIETENAVKDYQTKSGIFASGVADFELLNKLLSKGK